MNKTTKSIYNKSSSYERINRNFKLLKSQVIENLMTINAILVKTALFRTINHSKVTSQH